MQTDDNETVIAWKSNILSDESMKPPTALGNSLTSKLNWIHNSKTTGEISCLKQDKASFTHENVVNLLIVYELDLWLANLNTKFALGDSLFEAVKLTKKTDPDRYGCCGCASGLILAQMPIFIVNWWIV